MKVKAALEKLRPSADQPKRLTLPKCRMIRHSLERDAASLGVRFVVAILLTLF
jgi:hypothetical protein